MKAHDPGPGAAPARHTVLVVGGGFSGLLTALHLLSDPLGPQVRLVERRGVFARGLAYSTAEPEHLLNVRVGNMSAFPDDPDHFVRWLAGRSDANGSGAFVTRKVYGEYLQSLLRAAVAGQVGPQQRLLLEADEVVDLVRLGSRWRAETAMGRQLWSDAVVLAVGAAPSPPLSGTSTGLLASSRYVADPWRAGDLARELGARVLLLGTGLTMVDVAVMLRRPDRRIVALSRRGLAPRAHDGAPPAAGRLDLQGSPAQVLRQLRRRAAGASWRAVIDQARGSVPDLWRAWSPAERRRFLRHARPWWDVHRHRMAPAVAGRIDAMLRSGELAVGAAAIARLDLEGQGVRAEWRARGSRRTQVSHFEAVVNCTGQGGGVDGGAHPLLGALVRRGAIRADPCGLGLDVTPAWQAIDACGRSNETLFAVGPLTRGAQWEVTAVPDIGRQARDVAQLVSTQLRYERRIA